MSNDNWSAQIYALWKERCGGPPQVWNLKALKPLIDRYGVDVVKRVLAGYLQETDVQYISMSSFISKFGLWKSKIIPQVKVNPSRFTPH